MMGEETSQFRDAVTWVCIEEPGIRKCLERAGDTSPLDQFITAVRDGGEVSERLNELDATLMRLGDALGVFGRTQRSRGFLDARLVGMGAPRPAEVAFLCPRGICSRVNGPQDPTASSSTPMTCQVYGEPLRWTRL